MGEIYNWTMRFLKHGMKIVVSNSTYLHLFQDIVLGFISDIFSFEKCRYTTLDDLAEDIVRLGKERCEAAVTKLSS